MKSIDLKEEYVSTKKEVKGRFLHFRIDEIKLSDGRYAEREYIKHGGAVAVIPVDSDGNVYLVRQYRYAVGAETLEIPAGKLDQGETDRLEAAKRELREETGYTAQNFTYIGDFYPSPAILSENISMYVATGLQKGEQDLDEDEFLDVVKVPFDEVVRMILNNEITDGKTQTAVMKTKLLLNL